MNRAVKTEEDLKLLNKEVQNIYTSLSIDEKNIIDSEIEEELNEDNPFFFNDNEQLDFSVVKVEDGTKPTSFLFLIIIEFIVIVIIFVIMSFII